MFIILHVGNGNLIYKAVCECHVAIIKTTEKKKYLHKYFKGCY